LVGIFLAVHDLTELFGDDCRHYCKRVSLITVARVDLSEAVR
jgi:hypothetical protein